MSERGEWVAGRIPVLECLRAKKRAAHRLWLLRGAKGVEDLRALAAGLPIEECSRQELDRILPETLNQGVVLRADPLPVHKAETWIAAAAKAGTVIPAQAGIQSEAARRCSGTLDSRLRGNDGYELIVALDEIQDPHNFGAIIRTAVACGAKAILFPKDRAAPLSAAALKSAAGGMEYADLVQATNLVRALDLLREAGWWTAELDAEAPQVLWDADLTGRLVLVIGSEGSGVRRLVRERCDFHLRIPLPGPISDLNASVSAGIALAECLRQRAAKSGC